MRKLLIDTDPGVDDALAILIAFAAPDVDVIALTTVGGNVGLDATTANALRLLEWLGRADVPVFRGADRALLHAVAGADFVHGLDGFGDAQLSPPTLAAQSMPAALAMIEAAQRDPGALDLVALGPLTNLALAVALEPRLPQWLRRVVVMGGALSGRGNTTATAEFNIGYDAEAAAIVFARFAQIELVDWELTLQCAPLVADCERWFAVPTEQARFMRQISRKTLAFVQGLNATTWAWADPLAMAIYLDPALATSTEQREVTVGLHADATRGMTVVNWRDQAADGARIVLRADASGFAQRLADLLTTDRT